MLNSMVGLSWIGTTCLCPRDAERELVALREQPVLDKDLLEKRTARARQYRREIEEEKRPWRPPSPSPAILPTTQGCLAPYRSLTTDQVIENCQEEVMALHQALADKPNYRLAQRSMYNLGDLEIVLWEAFSKERFAVAQAETRKLKRAQDIERASLEARLKERGSQLWAGCKRQADALRKEYQVRPAYARAAFQGASTAEESTATNASANPADTSSESEIKDKEGGVGNPGTIGEDMKKCGIVQRPPIVFPKMTAAGMGRAPAKEKLELRGKMARHFASLTHAERVHHLQDASRVVASIEELEEKDRQGGRGRANYSLDQPEKSTLFQQQQLQAEAIQRQKHNRLLRSHERSRDETMRLLSVRNHRALRRLSERRHVETRRRKEELRQCLVAVKGEVARAWRKHNRSRGITVKGLEKPKNVGSVETPAESSKLEASPSSAGMAVAAPTQSELPKNEVLALRHRVAMKKATVISKPEMGLMDTNNGGNVDLLSQNFCQQEAGGSNDIDRALPGQDQGFGDGNVDHFGDGVSVGGCPTRKKNDVAEPSSQETRAEDKANTEPLLQNDHVSIERLGARGPGETSLRQEEADAQLQAPTTDGEDVDDVIADMSSGGSSSCRGTPKGQNDEAGHVKSGTCTSGDTANGDERAKHSKNATSTVRQRGGAVYRKKRQGAEAVTGCSIPTFPNAEVNAPVGVLGSVIGVLSPAEANALLALGRIAPEGPDVLLTSPAGPLERWANVVEQGNVQDGNEVAGNPEDNILDRAVDKLVAEIREKENSTRKRLGMAPLIF